jgi:hypothetical protein
VNIERGAQRALDVVAVCDRRAEHAHHRVADVLVDRAARALDRAVRELEVAREDTMDLLGVQPARHSRVTREIGEQDRDLPALADRRRAAARHVARQAAPHAGQKRAPGGSTTRHCSHSLASPGMVRFVRIRGKAELFCHARAGPERSEGPFRAQRRLLYAARVP